MKRLAAALLIIGLAASAHAQTFGDGKQFVDIDGAVVSITNVVDTSGSTASVTNTVVIASPLEIAKGNISGTTYIHKFGEAPDFDTSDGLVTIWDGANDGGIDVMQYVYSASADIDTITSDDNGDTQDIEVQGLDTNWNLVIQTVTLTGQTEATLTTALIRAFRLKNQGTTDNAGHIYLFTGGGSTAGVPDVSTNTRACMQPTANQTLMSVYTVPNGKTGYLDSFYASLRGANKSTPVDVHLVMRPVGGVFQLKNSQELLEGGSSRWQHRYLVPESIAAKTDIEMQTKCEDVGVTEQSISGGFDLILVDN